MSEPGEATVGRFGSMRDELSDLWTRVAPVVAARGGASHATISRGVVRCILPAARSSEEAESLRAIMKELHAPGSRVAERLPHQLWDDVTSDVGDSLSRGIQQTFDRARVLNPG